VLGESLGLVEPDGEVLGDSLGLVEPSGVARE
jgi:hypothetical protein